MHSHENESEEAHILETSHETSRPAQRRRSFRFRGPKRPHGDTKYQIHSCQSDFTRIQKQCPRLSRAFTSFEGAFENDWRQDRERTAASSFVFAQEAACGEAAERGVGGVKTTSDTTELVNS